jgi:hypothetical protein
MIIQVFSYCRHRCACMCLSKCRSGSDNGGDSANRSKHVYMRSYITMFLFTYSSIADTVAIGLNCIEIGPYYVLQSTPAINCRSDFYHLFQPSL